MNDASVETGAASSVLQIILHYGAKMRALQTVLRYGAERGRRN